MTKSRASATATAGVPDGDSFSSVEQRLAFTRQRLPDFPVEYATLFRLTRHLNKRVQDLGNEALLPFGLNLATYNMLMMLYGTENNRLLASELAESSGEKRGNVTRICDELVAKQLIARVMGTADRRSVVVSLKAAGARLIESLAAPMTQLMQRLYSDFSEKELLEFQRLLRRQLNHIDRSAHTAEE